MNDRATDQVLFEPKIELIPAAALAPSETHIQQLRRKRYDMEALKDLTASIIKLGVQQPGVVRKLKALRGLASYEIVAGERRWRASRQANLAHFPCIVRELDDVEVLEIQLVENIQREELHELEEAAGYDELMKVGKLSADQVADKVGVSRSQVFSRLNLLKLDGDARKALEDGRLDVSRALVVASVAQPNQRAEALQLALLKSHDDKFAYSVRELRHKIVADKLSMPLTGAPFDPADALLLKDMGACGPCRFRTANCDPEALNPDVCTNLSCFHLKVKAQGDRTRQAVLDAGGKVLRGEDARKLSPSVKTVYGHIDLDHVAEGVDGFPEEAPTPPKAVADADDADEALEAWPPYRAWMERERLWQPRTYRALLEGQKYTPVVIEDPKTRAVRELLPFKEAQRLLKKVGIELPSYYNRQRPKPLRRSEGGSHSEAPAAQAKREAEERRRVEAEELRAQVDRRIIELVIEKHDGKLGLAELAYLGESPFQDLSDDAHELITKAFGIKRAGWNWTEKLAKLSSTDLPKCIGVALAAEALQEDYRGSEKVLDSVLKRLKIDRKKVEADVRATAKKAAEKAKK